MSEDRLEQLIRDADVRNDELRKTTLERIRLAEMLRNKETALSLKNADDITAFLDEKGFSAKDFIYVVRKLREDEGMEDEELSGSELRNAAGGLIDGMAPKGGGLLEYIEDFDAWVSSFFD